MEYWEKWSLHLEPARIRGGLWLKRYKSGNWHYVKLTPPNPREGIHLYFLENGVANEDDIEKVRKINSPLPIEYLTWLHIKNSYKIHVQTFLKGHTKFLLGFGIRDTNNQTVYLRAKDKLEAFHEWCEYNSYIPLAVFPVKRGSKNDAGAVVASKISFDTYYISSWRDAIEDKPVDIHCLGLGGGIDDTSKIIK